MANVWRSVSVTPSRRSASASPRSTGIQWTSVDFNLAYNPPCAFNPHTTCPLPPPDNRLDVRIEAGERNYNGPGAH
ncbi:MAG: DUF1684 domain-containing protein [Vicinamibacterales bacterium]|nr:DUF1684 domain-containing protein [Vicinamibacterales bacterium]